jgi:hypothetical protein
VALNNLLVAQDGRLKLADDEFGFGGMAGLMLEPMQGTRFGVPHTSPVELDFKDRPFTKNLGPIPSSGRTLAAFSSAGSTPGSRSRSR